MIAVAVGYGSQAAANVTILIAIAIVEVLCRQSYLQTLVAIGITCMIVYMICRLAHRLTLIALLIAGVIVNVGGVFKYGVGATDTAVPMVGFIRFPLRIGCMLNVAGCSFQYVGAGFANLRARFGCRCTGIVCCTVFLIATDSAFVPMAGGIGFPLTIVVMVCQSAVCKAAHRTFGLLLAGSASAGAGFAICGIGTTADRTFMEVVSALHRPG